MINIHKLDDSNVFTPEGERELLSQDKSEEEVRAFYALTGPARLEYAEKMAEAEANRIRTIRKAQAEGIVEIRKAEAEGLRLMGEALAASAHPGLVTKLAELFAAEEVADSLGKGQATKLFLSRDQSDLFGLVASLSEVLRSASTSPSDGAEPSDP